MNRREVARLDRDLSEYLDAMLAGLGRVERVAALRSYVTGLLLEGERKSIAPMAARLVDSPTEVEAMRQRLQQAVVVAAWSDSEMFSRLGRKADAELPGIEAFVVDDTGFAKKGVHSVGTARQYSGTLGRVDNCQVAVSLHLAGESVSACIGFDLYLPEQWVDDGPRREKAGVPSRLGFKKKHEIALAQIDHAIAAGVRRHVVLADAGYGDSGWFRDALGDRGLRYVVAVNSVPTVWPPESQPRLTSTPDDDGERTRSRYVDARFPPESIGGLAARLSYRKVTWRQGSKGRQSSRFAAVRIRTAGAHRKGIAPGDEQWLLAEWPSGEPKPTRFWLSTLPADTSVRALVRTAKLRWRVERDYQEMKQEVGLDHFEGRTWRGFHHHATLCAVAYAFLALRRALFPPEQDEVDDLAGAKGPATGPAEADRAVPALHEDDHPIDAADEALPHVIKSY